MAIRCWMMLDGDGRGLPDISGQFFTRLEYDDKPHQTALDLVETGTLFLDKQLWMIATNASQGPNGAWW